MGFQLRKGSPEIVPRLEHATDGSFEVGDPLKVTSGKVQIATAGADVYGIAMTAASGTEDTEISVALLTPNQTWSISVDGATTPAEATHVGNHYALTIVAGATLLNVAGGAAAGFVVEELDTRDTAADGSRVVVRAEYATCDGIGG